MSIFPKIKNNQKGFTIVELLVATLVFSIVLLILASSVLVITNNYFAGVTINKTQNTTRTIMSNLTQSFQFDYSGNAPSVVSTGTAPATTYGFCVGQYEYDYLLGYQLSGSFSSSSPYTSPHVMIEWQSAGCKNSNTPTPPDLTAANLTVAGNPITYAELMGSNMTLLSINITTASGAMPSDYTPSAANFSTLVPNSQHNLNTFLLDVKVGYGTTDSYSSITAGSQNTSAYCKANEGFQFCHTSEMITQVVPRVNQGS